MAGFLAGYPKLFDDTGKSRQVGGISGEKVVLS
jgi:hypothetical protein